MTASRLTSAHVADANRSLAQALHYHRHFGQPIAGFSAAHNAARARANEATVAAYAFEAGRSACFSGRDPGEWRARCAGLSEMDVWGAFVDGYDDTTRMLAGEE